jgi:hypothetical protein
MEHQILLNEALVKKLDSISCDIKYYLNIGALIAEDIEKEDAGSICLMYNSDIIDLYTIMRNIKALSGKLKTQLDNKFEDDEH